MPQSKKSIIRSINYNTKTRLKPSTVCSGVGVFALIDIKKGEDIFLDISPDLIFIKWELIQDNTVKDYLSTMCNSNDKGIYLSRLPNEINISYYVNHSEQPNVFHDLENDRYLAIRDIQAGEEILCKYTDKEKADFII